MIQLHINAEKHVGGKVLKGSKKELVCKKCRDDLDIIVGIMYCPYEKAAWCSRCFDKEVLGERSRHRHGMNIDFYDLKVDKLDVSES